MDANKIRRYIIVAILVVVAVHFVYVMYIQEEETPQATPDSVQKEKKIKLPQPAIASEWLEFIDQQKKYRIRYPDSWQMNDHTTRTTGSGLIRADFSDGELAGFQVRVQSGVTQDLETFADTYITQFMQDMQDRWKGEIGEIDRAFEKMGRHEGFRAALMHKRPDGKKWFLKQFLWKRGDEVYIFQCGALSGYIHIYEPMFDKVAGSFTLL